MYLYKKTASTEEFARRQKAADEIEELSNAPYEAPGYKEMTKQEQGAIYQKSKEIARTAAARLNVPIDEYGSVEMPEEQVEIDSERYPEHYFKLGYFRSSYNSGGINQVMDRLGLPGLYEVLGYDKSTDDYRFTPDWEASMRRATEAAAAIRNAKGGDIDIMEVGPNPFMSPSESPKTEQEARAIVLEQLERNATGDGYSNGRGHFYPNGISVIALIPGTNDSFTKQMFGHPMPCTYVAYRKEGGNEWYAKAMEIVADTCAWVLKQEDPSAYLLHWSS